MKRKQPKPAPKRPNKRRKPGPKSADPARPRRRKAVAPPEDLAGSGSKVAAANSGPAAARPDRTRASEASALPNFPPSPLDCLFPSGDGPEPAQGVLPTLEALLLTLSQAAAGPTWQLDCFGYGLPPETFGKVEPSHRAQLIQEAVERYEPRLKDIQVTVEPAPTRYHQVFRLSCKVAEQDLAVLITFSAGQFDSLILCSP